MKNLLISILLLSLTACGKTQNIKYSVLEKAGIHKRDILVDRIEKTSEVQEEAKEDFQSAYERLSELVDVDVLRQSTVLRKTYLLNGEKS